MLDVATGTLLVVGYLTPFAAIGAGLSCVGTFWGWFQPPLPNLFEAKMAAALTSAIAGAVVCLGPGAFSTDSHLFGRREIVIADASGRQKI